MLVTSEVVHAVVKNGVLAHNVTFVNSDFNTSDDAGKWFTRRNIAMLIRAMKRAKGKGHHHAFAQIAMKYGGDDGDFHWGYFPADMYSQHHLDMMYACCKHTVVNFTYALVIKLALLPEFHGITFTVVKNLDVGHSKCAMGIKATWD